MKYWTGAHTKHRLKYHLVWIPKYRRRVLLGKIAAHLKALLYQAAEMNQWYIEELAVEKDHLHMLVQLRPDTSVAHAVQIMKGGTSRVIRQEHPELEEFLWGDSLWADGYFAETVGVFQEEMIQKYIREQAAHHGSSVPRKRNRGL